MNQNWFEIWTDSNDPTNVVMRRLSDDEALEARLNQLQREIQAVLHRYATTGEVANELRDFWQSPSPDPKAEARKRSRDDLHKKRKQLMKYRGKR